MAAGVHLVRFAGGCQACKPMPAMPPVADWVTWPSPAAAMTGQREAMAALVGDWMPMFTWCALPVAAMAAGD